MNEDKRSVAGIVLTLLVIAAIGAAVIFFLTDFKLENIEIRSGNYYSEQEIQDFLFTEPTDRYAVLFVYRINKFAKPKLPFVEKIDAELNDRNSVTVYVYDKAITGCISHMGEYIFFDREGIVADSAKNRPESIPEIKGLSIDSYTMGKKLEAGRGEVFDTILEILKLLEKNRLNADSITFGLKNEITLETGGSEVLLGQSDSYDFKINNLPAIIGAAGEGRFRFDMRNYSEDNMEVDARRLE